MTGRGRRLVLERGEPAQTGARVTELLGELDDEAVAWVSSEAPTRAFVWLRPHELVDRLGQGFHVVVLDAHAGLDADLLGQAQGMVFGGGALVLRLGPIGAAPAGLERLAAYPHASVEVGRRFVDHVEGVLSRLASASPASPKLLGPADRRTQASAEQTQVVARLLALWSAPGASRAAIVAERGRGKSSALGLALAELADRPLRITGPSEAAVGEVLRFAGEGARFVPLLELIAAPVRDAVIVVDEAAQLPVPLLQRLVVAHPDADLAFATTTHGYEGTGRGFVLRFLAWLERRGVVERLELRAPIRWAAGDPVEQAIYAALLLDAEPARLPAQLDVDRVEFVRLDRDALAGDLPRLRELFGLLVHAHYRTTPGDLQRLLDAPNLEVHAGLLAGRVVAACVVAREGGLPEAMIEEARSGRMRLRAHAIPDVLVAHLGHAEAGALRVARSVRIAVHPELRRRGIATRLVEHVHASVDAELFGTLFGATAELVEFRRRLGYAPVRVSASRGARTGEPSLLMLRPVSARARALVEALRRELAREIELQLALLEADEGLGLAPELVAALRAGLPSVEPYSAAECRAAAIAYAWGPRTFESVATALRGYVANVGLDGLGPELRAVVVGRVIRGWSWARVTREAGLGRPNLAMRALRRGIRVLKPDSESGF